MTLTELLETPAEKFPREAYAYVMHWRNFLAQKAREQHKSLLDTKNKDILLRRIKNIQKYINDSLDFPNPRNANKVQQYIRHHEQQILLRRDHMTDWHSRITHGKDIEYRQQLIHIIRSASEHARKEKR